MTRHHSKPFRPDQLMKSLESGNQRIRAEARAGHVVDGEFGIGREVAYVEHVLENLPDGGMAPSVEAYGSFVVPYVVGFKDKNSAAECIFNLAPEDIEDLDIDSPSFGEGSPLSPVQFQRKIQGRNETDGQRLYVKIPGHIYSHIDKEREALREMTPFPMKKPVLYGSEIDLGTFAKSGDAKRARKFFDQRIPGIMSLAGLSVIQVRQN